jgi:SAM-dependent methyltransferase
MDEIAELKYKDTASFIQPGRIGDIGCAVGSWIRQACLDDRFRESYFYGIEVSRHLYEICQQRKYNGEFANPFVFFSQRNAVTGLAFEKASMNTIHTSSLTHEIESYGSRADLLQFIKNCYEELAPGGV